MEIFAAQASETVVDHEHSSNEGGYCSYKVKCLHQRIILRCTVDFIFFHYSIDCDRIVIQVNFIL